MKENKMGTMSIPKLVLSISFPIMISMLVQSLYNIVDGIYVSQLGENAISAVSLVGPVQNIMNATACGSAIGINAMLAKSLGEKKTSQIENVASHGMFLAICSSVIFAISVFFFARPFYSIQAEVGTQLYKYCIDYQTITFVFSIGVFGQSMIERLLQSTGKTFLSMSTHLLGALINLILDPLLIHGYWIFPKLEVRGAAIATVIGQIAAFGLGLILNKKYNKEITVNLRGFRPNFALIKNIYKIAIPSILNLSVASIAGYFLNGFVLSYGTTALALYGISEKIRSFFFMPIGGLNSGLIPIMAYNYGAGNKKRVLKSLGFGIGVGLVFLTTGAVAFVFFPRQLLSIFNATDQMVEIGIPMMRAYAIYFFPVVFGYVFNSIFQGLGKSYYALIVSVVKQATIIPIAYILKTYCSMQQFWYTQFFSEMLTALSVFICFFFLYRTVIRFIGESKEENLKQKQLIKN